MYEQDPSPGSLWRELARAEDRHVSYEQLEAYVDQTLDETEAELVQAHAELCARCNAELNDLRAFATGLRTRAEPEPERRGIGARMAAWLTAPRHALALGAAAAALLAVFVVLPRSERGIESGAALTTARLPIEAVLDPGKAARGKTFVEDGRVYRVLTQQEHDAYEKALTESPDDPAARGAIAERFMLFGEAENDYRQVLASDPARGRALLDRLSAPRGGR